MGAFDGCRRARAFDGVGVRQRCGDGDGVDSRIGSPFVHFDRLGDRLEADR
ncbi:MAG: hypothetical protein ABW024_06720 [Microbacterium sp.]